MHHPYNIYIRLIHICSLQDYKVQVLVLSSFKSVNINYSIFQSENNVMHKLNALTVGETKALLHRYFGKVVDLKENDRKKDLLCSELEVP